MCSHKSRPAGLWTLVALLFFAGAAQAGAPYLVADVDKTPQGSGPDAFTELDGRVFFTADRPLSGRELWVTDGTTDGTRMVKDVYPGKRPSYAAPLTVFDGRLWFSGVDPVHGAELWASDGSEAGTVLVRDVASGPEDGAPLDLTAFAERLWFTAADGIHGRELWTSDGTEEGTRLFLDLDPGGESRPRGFTALGDRLFFVAETEAFGRELWVTDGTQEGTRLFWDTVPGPRSGTASTLLARGGRLYFQGWDGSLWVTNGSEGGGTADVDLSALDDPRYLRWVGFAGERLLFTTGYPEKRLWALHDLAVERLGDLDGDFSTVESGGVLFFRAETEAHGEEIWRSDGTVEGTDLAIDTVPGESGSHPHPIAFENGRLWYSTLIDGARELWLTDGFSGAATRMARLGFSSTPAFQGGRMWFAGLDADHGDELWSSDGTPEGTALVRDVNETGTGSWLEIAYFAPFLRRLAVFVSDELWLSDGSEGGTFQVRGPEGLDFGNPPGLHAELGDRLYFRGEQPATGTELWWTDGERIELFEDLAPGPDDTLLLDIASIGGRLLFGAGDHAEVILWGSDGQKMERLIRREDDDKLTIPGDRPEVEIEPLGEAALVFLGWRSETETRETLWRSDGTGAGTRRIAELRRPYPAATAAAGDRLYFFRAGEPLEIWRSDGTAAGTRRLMSLPPGLRRPRNLVAAGDRVAFLADSPELGDRRLWVTGETAGGVHVVLGDFAADQLVAAGGRLYVETADPRNRRRLWELDPVSRGVLRYLDLEVSTALTAWGGVLYFTHDEALWRTDGTPEGTARLGGPAPRALAFPHPATAGGLLFFEADDDVHGEELWAVAPECIGSREVLCLGGGRFQARGRWRHPAGTGGAGRAAPLGDASGTFYFFAPDWPEIALKVIDGRALNDHFWVFSGAATDLAVDLHLFDTATGGERRHLHPAGDLSSFADVRAFADGEDPGAAPSQTPSPAAPVSVSRRTGPRTPCVASATTLCLVDDRFAVAVEWHAPAGDSGAGGAREISGAAGTFVFFRDDNLELLVKIVDGRPINGRFWVWAGSLTDVAFRLTVRDAATGAVREYVNPQGRLGGFADVDAFGD